MTHDKVAIAPVSPVSLDWIFVRQVVFAAGLIALLLAILAYDFLRIKTLQLNAIKSQVTLNSAFHSNTVSQAVTEVVEELHYIAEQFDANNAWSDTKNRLRIVQGFNRGHTRLVSYSIVGFNGAQARLKQTTAIKRELPSEGGERLSQVTYSNEDRFTIEKPEISLIPETGLLLISRRLISPDKHFQGFLQAVIATELLSKKLGGLKLPGQSEVIQLIHLPSFELLAQRSSLGPLSGVLIAHEDIQGDLPDGVVMRLLSSTYHNDMGEGGAGVSLAIAYQKLEGLPLMTLSGIPLNIIQEKLQIRAVIYLLGSSDISVGR